MLKKILAFLSFVLAVIVALDSYVLLKKIYAASFELYVNSVYNFVIVAVPALIAAAIILLFIYLGIMLLGKKSNKRQFIETVILTVLLITAGIVYLKKICLPAMTDSIKAKTGMTLLMASSIQGDDKIKFTKNILKYFGKADINAKDTPPGLPAGDFGGGNTALHYAAGDLFLPGAKIKNIETVKLLIANGADVNSRNNAGETPLMNASPEAAEVLIKAGADINAKNNAGLTVLMYAAIHGDYRIELTKRILEQGKNADINATAKGGVSALHVAAISNTDEKKIETVKLLIANGADV
ncbi:MAG: ankyrin repeat domain-containing protein, partial [Endomicrobia bacterium]|nr:ankyrin repeat domain-containing protein [Endomicrobiia bacterium]